MAYFVDWFDACTNCWLIKWQQRKWQKTFFSALLNRTFVIESIEEACELSNSSREKKKQKKDEFKKRNKDIDNADYDRSWNDGNSKGHIENKCRKHSNHSWFDCLDNARNKSLNEGNFKNRGIIIIIIINHVK